MPRSFHASWAAFGLIALGLAPSVDAKPLDVTATLGVTTRYDDNVYQYSDRNLAAFNPSTAKFLGLDATDDLILTPSLDVRATLQGPRPTRFFAGVDLYTYAQNTNKSYQAYTLGVTQRLARKTDLTLRYRFIPSFLVGRFADPPNQIVTYADAEFALNAWRLALDADVLPELNVELFGLLEDKDYNAAFDERDTTVRGGGVAATARIHPQVRVKLGVTSEVGDAAGEGDTATNSDTSYREQSVTLKPTFSPARGWTVALGYDQAWKRYTSDLSGDVTHFGRKDRTRTLGLDAKVALTRDMDLKGEFDHIKRTSNRSGADLEFADYTEKRVTVGATYRF
jgi:hypothetical protein